MDAYAAVHEVVGRAEKGRGVRRRTRADDGIARKILARGRAPGRNHASPRWWRDNDSALRQPCSPSATASAGRSTGIVAQELLFARASHENQKWHDATQSTHRMTPCSAAEP